MKDIVVDPATIAAAKTSANALIKQITAKLRQEIAEKVAEIERLVTDYEDML